MPERPNILWIVAEDLSPIIPPFGDQTVKTPNLSRLSDEGVRYTSVFSTSGVCAPSRAALATGMYQNRIGAHHMRTTSVINEGPEGLAPYEAIPPPYVKMQSQYFREAGYYTTNNAKEDYQFQKPVTAWNESSPQRIGEIGKLSNHFFQFLTSASHMSHKSGGRETTHYLSIAI